MRKISILILTLVVVALFWYLFLKPQDYQVNFKAKTVPGTIYETVKAWNKTLTDSATVTYESWTHFQQKLTVNDSIHIYEWDIIPINDSLSHIKVNIKDPNHSLANKVKIPFSDTDFEKGSRKKLLDFKQFLDDHLGDFKVSIMGDDSLFTSYCACIPIKTTQEHKASGIMANYSFISSILVENQVEMNGPPMLEVVDWDIKADSLSYNFCYPIIRSEKLPQHPDLIYKRINIKKALKAVYNGNYITSDRAWHTLLNYAEENNITLEKKPVEVFFNNPKMGGNERQWKTDVYMPIKDPK